ncbi:MAG: hypothetical protein HQL23_07765 [Candidatus Omnitrophica bacterium]|nr:hypothetical protein [Candidatus Omnitrophota bacterium]
MNREEIYDHLAQVYLGKRKEVDEKKRPDVNAWLILNICVTLIIFSSVFYGLTAFLTQRGLSLRNHVVYALYRGPARLDYNFEENFLPVKSFDLNLSRMDASPYRNLSFAIRNRETGTPGVVKVVIRNQRNEIASYYLRDVRHGWREYSVPLAEFSQIADWSCLTDVSFVVESWNVTDHRGEILIEDISFTGSEAHKV